MPIVEVDLERLSGAFSPRIAGENPEHLEALLSAQGQIPPILVHFPSMRVIDGLHRLSAARLRGQRTIAARFFEGSEADAFVLAVRMNIEHGLPLTLADRRRAARRIIGSHPEWSDRMVASAAGVSAGTVADLRGSRMEGEARIGRDGRVRPLDGTAERRQAAELIRSDPTLSLRQIARKVGLSPETVRDVRGRLERGESPIPAGRRRSHIQPVPQPSAGDSGRAFRLAEDQDRLAMLNRLKADPALRLTETGRSLLRLLAVHAIPGQDWDRILMNVPPRWGSNVSDLARAHAAIWTEFADRLEGRLTGVTGEPAAATS
ncbi:ParB N-terminal domain-containing protein [Nonomuraea sp. NN258]|uniref:ParB and winged helix-turn-helix domain-containing protein n=1 Tax=Nonomuraea antri TaxID=2730852 RepID=UPI0015688626|nr:ParB N-terminal domain-containing protein [Nonomuraea antri]NRQ31697.1 ParB N-terminal domain-containing protein [Nonomuraea antri]